MAMFDSATALERLHDGGAETLSEPVDHTQWLEANADLIIEAAQDILADDEYRATLREEIIGALDEAHHWASGPFCQTGRRDALKARMLSLFMAARAVVRDAQGVRFKE